MVIKIVEQGQIKNISLESFGKEFVSFGRNPECDIVLNSGFVSDVHGVFYIEDGQWKIQDMQSMFGIYSNGNTIKDKALNAGEILELYVKDDKSNMIQMVVENESAKVEVKQNTNPKSASTNKNIKIAMAVIVFLVIVVVILGIVLLNSKSDKGKNNDKKSEVAEREESTSENKREENKTEEKDTEGTTSQPTTEEVVAPELSYRAYLQTDGWHDWSDGGELSGTTGEAKRLEAIEISLSDSSYKGDIIYTAFVQGYGWIDDLEDKSTWSKNGETCGTTGEAKRIEAICINLTEQLSKEFDIYYRVHAQSYGWMAWAKNGEPCGTTGYAKRIESIQVVVVKKGEDAPAANMGNVVSIADSYVEAPDNYEAEIYEPLIEELNNIVCYGNLAYVDDENISEDEKSFKAYLFSTGVAGHFGYGLYDVDNNGIRELIVCSGDCNCVLGMYSIKDGKPVGICFGWFKQFYRLLKDGTICSMASNGATGSQEIYILQDDCFIRKAGFIYEDEVVYYVKDGDNRTYMELYNSNFAGCEIVDYNYMFDYMSAYEDKPVLELEFTSFIIP
ncbi:MAG: FHA domain-containing protein [Lachnospiraceae bacterium]|nr:FHA domain-containing protein [Lachnospiraceae bacterium]